MADLLLQLSSNQRARRVVSTLGLPLPMPERLERGRGPWEDRPLHDRVVVVDAGPGSELVGALAPALVQAGADPWVVGGPEAVAAFRAAGEGWGRLPHDATDDQPERPWALILDATGLRTVDDLRRLYAFFHPRIRGIGRSGRLIVLSRPADADDADVTAGAVATALEGFVRSAGREVGRRGATANLIQVDRGAEDRLEPLLRFVASPRSAYVSGQVLRVSNRVGAAAVRGAL
ncbi:MAG: short chain dehydrogenase, partial [Myxococcota bacterium]